MILTHKTSFPSAKLLRDAICEELGWDSKHLLVTKNPEKIVKLHLRYGNSSPTNKINRHRVANSRKFIMLCSDKALLAEKLKERAMVGVPEFKKLNQFLPSKDDFPFLIRQSLNSSGAKGIVIFQEYQAFLDSLVRGSVKYNWYWTPYYNFKEEYRVHVLGGSIAKIFRKELLEEKPEEDIFIRNNDNSHFYRIKVEKTPENVIKLVKKFHDYVSTLSAKPVYFTALDIGVLEDGSCVFIEANSAPGLNEETAKLYAKYIIATCPIFSETEEEMSIAKELKKKTANIGIDWAIEF